MLLVNYLPKKAMLDFFDEQQYQLNLCVQSVIHLLIELVLMY